jgi:hypothetical protein
MSDINALYARATDPAVYGHTDIFAHLPRLVALARRVLLRNDGTCKIVELGVGNGDQSTISWLYALAQAKAGELHCYGLYEPGNFAELQQVAAAKGTTLTLKVGDLRNENTPRESDILFVDSYHERTHILHELEVFAPHTRHYIVFHDTTSFGRVGQDQNESGTGVLDAIEQFVAAHPEWAWDVQYYDCNGLALLRRVASAPPQRNPATSVVRSAISDTSANVGVVIGTFAAVPYVHLSLAALRKHEPSIAIMVHDDCSPEADKLRTICAQYDAEYYTLPSRRVATVGDLSAVAQACRWSYRRGCDIGVKLSRRFIINRPFVFSLRELFYNMQMPTVCGACATFGFGYRSECVAMWTPSWLGTGVVDEMDQIVAANKEYSGLPEGWYHEKAKKVYEQTKSAARQRYDKFYPVAASRAAFTDWPLLGLGRAEKVPGILWHDSHTANDYWALAQEFNLPYTAQEFSDPNMGYGDRPK